MSAADEQAAFWNGPAGERWVREQRERDAMLAPYGEEVARAAAIGEGDAVLDVGCGCGTTSLAIADRVGARGRVVGVDVSAPMVARATALAKDRDNARFVVADATTAPLAAAAFDVAFSRFGVMFFADPPRAFANVRAAMKPGGRLAFVCWRAMDENPWAQVPLDAAKAVLGGDTKDPIHGAPPAAGDGEPPGPFAFARPARVRAILEKAGFGSIDVRPFDARVVYGATLDEAAARVASIGPASRLLADRDADTIAKVVARTREAIAPHAKDVGGTTLPGAAWIVTGRA